MKVDIEENESTFQSAMKEWKDTHDNKYSEIMFDCINKACTNIALSIYARRGFSVGGTDIVYNKALEATLICMRNIMHRGHEPNKLSSYCYLRVLAEINKREDSHDRLCNELLKSEVLPEYYDLLSD